MDKLVNHPNSLIDTLDLLRLLLNTDRPAIFEIGCNDGTDSLRFVEAFPNLKLHCFEPEPRAIQSWKEKVKNENCILHEVALSNHKGTTKFYQSSGTKKGAHKKDWDLSGSLNKPTGHSKFSPWVKFKDQIEVEVDTLDSYFNWYDSLDLIWLDVQGGERNVIEGGRETLKHTRFLYTEYGHWKSPLYQGQMNLHETIECLGADWKPVATYEGYNLLAVNKNK